MHKIFAWHIIKSSSYKRLVILLYSFLFCFIIIALRLISVTKNLDDVNDKLVVNKANTLFARKEILDCKGNILALNLPITSLFANPKKIKNPEEVAENLTKIFKDLDKNKILKLLKSDKSFVWIKHNISPYLKQKIEKLGLIGIDFEHKQKRIYPFGNLLSHIIGYVGIDYEGLAGIEKYYDLFLKGEKQEENSNISNQNLTLSIDIRIQNILSEEMEKTMKDFSAKAAVGIIADPNSGEIIAMVSKPDFDPYFPEKSNSQELFNNASLGVYESGSVFKTLIMAIAFDSGNLSLNDAYDLTEMSIGRYHIKDYHPLKGFHSVGEIFLHSSNIGISQILLEVGENNFKKYLEKLKLFSKLDIELPEKAKPIIPNVNSKWNDLSMATMSYGYGMSFSPLHIVQALLPIVNGGYFYPLTLIKKDKKANLKPEKIFNKDTTKQMKKLLRLVVAQGTGRKADIKGYYIGGKTGTTNKIQGKTYANNKRMSSFFGVFPLTNPKYIAYIMFDEPKGNKESFGFATAHFTAAPTVGRVFERIITLNGIEEIDENTKEVKEIEDINYKISDAI